MEKKLSELARKEWIRYQWVLVDEFGVEERMMVRGPERTPDDAFEAAQEWEVFAEARSGDDNDE